MRKKTLSLFFLITLSMSIQSGDLHLDLGYSGIYSNNIFLNSTGINDLVNQLQAELSYSQPKLNLYFNVSSGIYLENPEFNSFQIEPGLEYLHPMKNRNVLYLNLNYVLNRHRDYFTDFNYSGPMLHSGVKVYLNGRNLIKAGLNVEYRDYEFSSFDFINNSAYVELSRFFSSQTTLRLKSGINYRFYPHIADYYETDDDYNYFRIGQQKKGRRIPNIAKPLTHTMSIPNISGQFSLAQGLGTRLGITAEVELRKNFRGLENAETLIKNSYIVYPYNDDYLWDGTRFSIRLKAILFNEFELEAVLSKLNKNYPGIYVLDEKAVVVEPRVQRLDNQIICLVSMTKKMNKLDVFINVSLTDNKSADDFFRYSRYSVFTGINYLF